MCSSNLADVDGVRVLVNVEIVRFLQRAVQYIPEKLSDKAWDFILCTTVSLMQVKITPILAKRGTVKGISIQISIP